MSGQAPINYLDLGNRLRQKRENMNWTQAELAKRISVTGAFIGHIERAEKVPSLETLARLCASLDTTMDWLVFGVRHRCEGIGCPLYVDLEGLMRAYGLKR